MTLESLNTAIEKLNIIIAYHEGERNHRRLESFTDAEIESIIGASNEGVASRTVMLALVSLQRLDLVTEHAVKVFRVRRFY